MEIIVYTTNLTNRVKYAFSLVIKNVLGHKPVFVTSVEELHSSQFPKINYSENIFENALNIVPHSLLFENGIQKQNIQVEKINNIFFFFRTSGNNAFPHDIFAAAFYLATRYEEYLPHLKDKMGRFCITNSLAFKENFLDEPVINQWAEKLLFFLNENQQIKIHDNRIFSFLPTIDIDNPWAYLHKGRFRSIAGAVRDLLRGKTKLVALRKKVLAGKEKDPYDTFSVLKEIHEKFSLKPVYFFLVGKYNKYGKNPSAKKKPYRKLIKSIAENNITGIHPSFPSNIYFKELGNEITVLKKTTKKKITKSRQHFLMLTFPETYCNLIAHGIDEDYTMAFPEKYGFRAGICSPYPWYDLLKEKKQTLTIVPTCVMDTTLNRYMKLSPQQAKAEIEELIDKVKKVKGTFVSLWHNESLSEWEHWKGWKEVYEELLEKIS